MSGALWAYALVYAPWRFGQYYCLSLEGGRDAIVPCDSAAEHLEDNVLSSTRSRRFDWRLSSDVGHRREYGSESEPIRLRLELAQSICQEITTGDA